MTTSALSNSVGAIAILAIAFFTAGAHGVAQTPDALDRAPSRFATTDGNKVHYKSVGQGAQALVLVHGWTCDLTAWRYQVPAFAGKIRLILVDLPGHGMSDKPRVDYTMNLFARAIDAVLKDAGVRKALLVGHSLGTPVVRQYYRQFRQKTIGLVAVDGALRQMIADPSQIQQFVGRFEGPDYKENLGRAFDSMFAPETPADLRESVKAVSLATPQHVVVSAMRGMMDPDIWKNDPIGVPLMVINAKNPMWTEDYQAYVRKLCPKARLQVMEGVGHFLMMEKPAEFNRLLASFLAELKLIEH
jgi:pimeloyl-ACP methyl ester carboxylesterase